MVHNAIKSGTVVLVLKLLQKNDKNIISINHQNFDRLFVLI